MAGQQLAEAAVAEYVEEAGVGLAQKLLAVSEVARQAAAFADLDELFEDLLLKRVRPEVEEERRVVRGESAAGGLEGLFEAGALLRARSSPPASALADRLALPPTPS